MHTRAATTLTQNVLLHAFGERPFTSAEAVDAGVSRRRLAGAVAAGKVNRVGRTLYTAGTPQARSRLLRLQQDFSRKGVPAPVAGRSAADIWSVPVLGRHGRLATADPTLWVPPGSSRPGLRGGVRYGIADVPESHLVTLSDGLVVTGPLRTAVDVVRLARLPRHLALASLNAGLRAHVALGFGCDLADAGRITELAQQPDVRSTARAQLMALVGECPSWGIQSVRRCFEWLDPRIETALESVSWGRFIEAGVPLPIPQVWLRGASRRLYRVDFWWETLGVIGECDGLVKYSNVEAIREEKERQWDLEAPGRRMMRWGWSHAIKESDPLLGRLFAQLPAVRRERQRGVGRGGAA